MTAQAEGGAIVNIGDWAEARPYLNYAAYFPSKGAVTAITRSMAVELAALAVVLFSDASALPERESASQLLDPPGPLTGLGARLSQVAARRC